MAFENLPVSTEFTLSLHPEVEEILQKSALTQEEKSLIVRAFSMSFSHSGPLPDKETIAAYNREIPNGGDRLMKEVENQTAHRIEEEKTALRRSFNQSSTGQWMGFIIALTCLGFSFFLIYTGHDVAGTVLGTVDIVSLVGVFIAGRFSSKKQP